MYQRTQVDPLNFLEMKRKSLMLKINIAQIGLVVRNINRWRIIKEHVYAIQASGTLVIQVRMLVQLLVVLILMKCYGNLIGLAVEKVGRKKVAQRLIIEGNIWMSIFRTQESMNGLIGEYRHTLRRLFHHFGKRKLKNNMLMIMICYSGNWGK